MKLILDRFEGNLAICETDDRNTINLDRKKLPPDAKEGDILIVDNNTITVSVELTKKRKKEIQTLVDDLWE